MALAITSAMAERQMFAVHTSRMRNSPLTSANLAASIRSGERDFGNAARRGEGDELDGARLQMEAASR
ncbi:hypothetical protein GCM10022419_043860 [Nonomuraea rosea]|uniref:Uncharacterized protein n=1 Tax=Nonomuraea rosea TaxID=638574 RepID=A0ABP6WZB7_9ACTN